MFKLDPKLSNDTFFVCDLTLCKVLLMNDSQFPWLILVPRIADVTEIIDLSEEDQSQLQRESAWVSKVLKVQFSPDKLNIAALGNMVSQLHIHHIARYKTDVAWPKPVWGLQPAIAYDDTAQGIIASLQVALTAE